MHTQIHTQIYLFCLCTEKNYFSICSCTDLCCFFVQNAYCVWMWCFIYQVIWQTLLVLHKVRRRRQDKHKPAQPHSLLTPSIMSGYRKTKSQLFMYLIILPCEWVNVKYCNRFCAVVLSSVDLFCSKPKCLYTTKWYLDSVFLFMLFIFLLGSCF